MVVLPSFATEWVVEIRREGDDHVVALGLPDRSIWDSRFFEGPDGGATEDFRPQDVAWTFAPLPSRTREQIGDVWRRTILRSRYPERPVLGLDGVTIHFSAWESGRGMISGQAWSPSPESLPGRLYALGGMLRRFVSNDEAVANLLLDARDIATVLDAME